MSQYLFTEYDDIGDLVVKHVSVLIPKRGTCYAIFMLCIRFLGGLLQFEARSMHDLF